MATAATIPPPRWKIPPFADGAAIVRSVAHLYQPQEQLGLAEWSIQHRGYDPETLPWQLEVMCALSDPETSEVGIMKPAQCGATTIGANWTGWIIDTDPSNMLICQPDRSMAEKFVKGRLDPMIESTRVVQNKLQPVSNANNQWIKLFRGMLLTTVWPVPAQFTQVDIRFGWLDDYDQYDDNIGESDGEGGQGSGVALLEGRFISYEGREKKFVSSSPAKDPRRGIEAFVAEGTDERLWPECPHCEERFEIDFLRDLHFDRSGTADLAERTAHVICPVNGCVLEPSDRRKLHESCLRLPNHGFVSANTTVSKRRRGFRVDGLMALPTWPTLARKWRAAQIAWEARQDESDLRSVINTQGGKNFRSSSSGEKPIDAAELKARREKGFHLGKVPAGVKVWIFLIDVQHNRYEVAAIGYGEGLECWIFDRFSVDVLEDGLTSPAPFTHPEHCSALLPLWNRRYPLADGSGLSPPPLSIQMDTGGGGDKGEGATAHAKAFWDASLALGIHRSRVTLTKGGSSPSGDLMPRAKFAEQKRRGGAKRSSAELWLPNVHRIKGIEDARLRRTTPGPGYIHLPGGSVGGGELKPGQDEGATGRMLDMHVEELAAEEMKKGKWVKTQPRNETWDLLVASYAVMLRPPFAQTRTHMRWVPKEFRVPDQAPPPDPDDQFQISSGSPARKVVQQPNKPPTPKAPVKRNPLTGKARGSYFGGRR